MKRFTLAITALCLLGTSALQTPRSVAIASPTPLLAQANIQPDPVDLNPLRAHLAAQDWRAADAETRRILQPWVHPREDIFGSPLPTNIPPELLQTLDQLWAEASGGRFGFRVQKAIWDDMRARHPNDTNVATKAFGDRVGWTRSTPDPDNFVAPEWLTEPELTYSLDAPEGHLPWAGIDWERIETLLSYQSCGSCMIDAIYLQGERFNRYLPVLFNWLSTALEAPIPAVGSWQQTSLAQRIEVRSLYPDDNTCPIYFRDQAVSPNGSVLAVSSYSYERSCGGSNNSTLALWNTDRGTRIITLLRGQATESFNYSGQPQEPPTEQTQIVGDVANDIAFTPDGRWVAAGLSNGTVRIWTTNGEAVRTLSGHRYAVRAIALSTDGQTLASASADQTVKLWNLQTGEVIQTIRLNPADGIPHTLLISPDGKRIATATNRNTLQLWEASTGLLIRTFVDQAIDLPPGLPIAFSPDSQLIATADTDNSIKLWNTNMGTRVITLRGHTQPVRHLAFSPNSQQLVSSQGPTARLWNLKTYETVRTLNLVQSVGHPILPDNLGYVAFNPDGTVLATSTLLLPLVESEPIPRQGLTLWDAATGTTLAQIHNVAQFQFSPNGAFLVAQGQTVQIWRPYRNLVSWQD